MSTAALAYAFSAGMLAAINPCGFALLPAYVSYYLGIETAAADDPATARAPVSRALSVGGSMTLGFVLVFGIIGAAWETFRGVVTEQLPWVLAVLGVVLVVVGIRMLFGYVPMVRLPKLATTSGSQTAWSAFVFGISYGVASLSCTIPLFIAAVTTTFTRHGALTGIVTFFAYALGMGAVICVLTLAVSGARHGVVRWMRRLLPHMGRISGVLLIVSGAVAVYYGWYEGRVLTGGKGASGGLAKRLVDLQGDVSSWITSVGEERIGIAIAIVIAGAVAISLVVRSGRSGPTDGSSTGHSGGGTVEKIPPERDEPVGAEGSASPH